MEDQPKRTKVDYVKSDLSLGDFIDGFRKGLLFYFQGGEYHQIEKENQAMFHAGNDSYFVKVETEIDERQEFIAAGLSAVEGCNGLTDESWLGKLFDSGEFKLVKQDNDRLVEENAELREALQLLVGKGIEINNIDEIEDVEGAFTVQCNFNGALIEADKILNK